MEWMLMPLRRYAEFSGRSRRKEYWMFLLLNMLVYAGLVMVLLASGAGASLFADVPTAAGNGLGIVGTLVFGLMGLWALGTIIPNIALQVRRLHDLGQSGWIYLGVIVAGLIPVVGGLVSLGFLNWMAFPGNEGANQYGEDPKDPNHLSVFE